MTSPDGTDDPSLELGFTSVDAQPDPTILIEGMDATATFPAVRQLRSWERERLDLQQGDRLIDVGCGVGEASAALAPQVQPGGRVLCVDVSEAMLEVARQRAEDAGLDIEFRIGDALDLGEPDGSFDACRSERMLQWVPDVPSAVREMVRVVRSGGRCSFIDSDWRTFAPDLPDVEASHAVTEALAAMRGPSAAAGSQLLNLCRGLGLVDIDCTAATHLWTEWDPDREPGPPGLFPLATLIPQLTTLGFVDRELTERFLDDATAAGRAGRFYMSLTMTAVSARVP